MGSAARIRAILALFLAIAVAGPEHRALGIEKDKVVPPGRLVIAGRRLTCGGTQTLLRDFEGFAVSSTVIMLNVQALNPLPQKVQWLIYYRMRPYAFWPQRNVGRLLRGAAGAARRLAGRAGARRHLRGVQHCGPRSRASGPRGALQSAPPMFCQEGRRDRGRRRQIATSRAPEGRLRKARSPRKLEAA